MNTVFQGRPAERVDGEFGVSIIVGGPDRPDKTEAEHEAERKSDRIKYRALLKELDWTDDQLQHAKMYNFPRSIGTATSWSGRLESFYSRREIAVWRERLMAFVATVK